MCKQVEVCGGGGVGGGNLKEKFTQNENFISGSVWGAGSNGEGPKVHVTSHLAYIYIYAIEYLRTPCRDSDDILVVEECFMCSTCHGSYH